MKANIPGFTAEASLDMKQKPYRSVVSDYPNGSIYLQLRGLGGGWNGCGLIGGWRKEDQFSDCMVECQDAGNPYHGCKRGCCKEVTGFSCCYIM